MERSLQHLSWADWKGVLHRLKDSIVDDHLSIISAGVTFYALLAIPPALIAIVSIYGLFSDPNMVATQIDAMPQVLPQEAAAIIGNQLNDIMVNSPAKLGLGAGLSIALTIDSLAATSSPKPNAPISPCIC
jgi:membrane protein